MIDFNRKERCIKSYLIKRLIKAFKNVEVVFSVVVARNPLSRLELDNLMHHHHLSREISFAIIESLLVSFVASVAKAVSHEASCHSAGRNIVAFLSCCRFFIYRSSSSPSSCLGDIIHGWGWDQDCSEGENKQYYKSHIYYYN